LSPDAARAPALSLELRVLLAACAAPADAAASRLPLDGIDWRRLATLAQRHRVRPQLAAGLAGEKRMPASLADRLHRQCRAVAQRNLLLTGRLLGIVSALGGEGIACIPYKGPALARHLYGDIGRREFEDLDILLRPADVVRAVETLRHAGFSPDLPFTPRRAAAYLRVERECHLTADDGTAVELHWAVTPRYFAFPLSAEPLWERSSADQLLGRQVRRLDWADLLLVLCAHGATHRWGRLQWICDVDRLVCLGQVDWSRVLETACRTGGRRMLLLGLLLARRLLSTPLPPIVLSAIGQDRALTRLADWVMRNLEATRQATGALAACWFPMCVRDRPRHRIECALRLALMPNAVQLGRVALPSPLTGLYAPLRLAHLAGRALREAASRRSEPPTA